MNIQQVINTFGNFIDNCAVHYPLISNNKDKVLDRCSHLYNDWQGLYFSNAEILGRSVPKSHFINYLGINSNEDSENPRNFFAFVTLRFNNAKTNAHTLSDIVRALQFAKEIETKDILLYFFNGEKEYAMSNLFFTETDLLRLDRTDIESLDQLASHLAICCDSTDLELKLAEQLNLLYRVFLKFNEQEV
jgi:hypothetical protein